MSTQVTTWPKGLYESDSPTPVTSATGRGRTSTKPLGLQSTFEHVPAILLTTFFAAEVVFVVGGLGVILASLAALLIRGGVR